MGCKHQLVDFVTRERRRIPQGYEAFSEQEEIDLEEMELVEIINENVCAECDEILE
jgi:hypothetical protein